MRCSFLSKDNNEFYNELTRVKELCLDSDEPIRLLCNSDGSSTYRSIIYITECAHRGSITGDINSDELRQLYRDFRLLLLEAGKMLAYDGRDAVSHLITIKHPRYHLNYGVRCTDAEAIRLMLIHDGVTLTKVY